MKNLLLVLFVLIIFSSNIFSGDVSRTGTTGTSSLTTLSGYGVKLLSGLGNSGLINSTSNLGFMNPASIGYLQNLSIGLTYQVNTPVYFPEPYDETNYDRVYNFIPQSFGAVYKYDDFTFGLSIGQEFNSKLDFGEIPVTSAQYPDGTGEYYTPVIEYMIENYSLSTAYNFEKSVFDEAEVSLGIRYTLNRFHGYEKLLSTVAEQATFASSIDAGILLKLEEMQFGLSFNSGKTFNATNSDDLQVRTTIPGTTSGSYVIETRGFEFFIPAEINFDARFQLRDHLNLTAAINNVFWSSDYSAFTNQLDISSSIIYDTQNMLSGSLGLMLSNCFLVDDYDYENEFNALFIMMGINLKFENFNIDFALADSHLLSGEFRKQAIAKLGLELQL
jgi:hypothetical protein